MANCSDFTTADLRFCQ